MAQHFAAKQVRQARGQGAAEHDRAAGVNRVSWGAIRKAVQDRRTDWATPLR